MTLRVQCTIPICFKPNFYTIKHSSVFKKCSEDFSNTTKYGLGTLEKPELLRSWEELIKWCPKLWEQGQNPSVLYQNDVEGGSNESFHSSTNLFSKFFFLCCSLNLSLQYVNFFLLFYYVQVISNLSALLE